MARRAIRRKVGLDSGSVTEVSQKPQSKGLRLFCVWKFLYTGDAMKTSVTGRKLLLNLIVNGSKRYNQIIIL